MTETLIKTEGCYLGIFDLSAAIHREESFSSIFEKGKVDAEQAQKSWAALFYINERLLQKTRHGEILVWIVLFDGCFKARIKVLKNGEEFVPERLPAAPFLNSESHPLNCPTGRIVVASLHELGSSDLLPTIEIEPGIYEVGLFQDQEQEAKHMFLDQAMDYPVNDGPDWCLVLNKVREVNPDRGDA
jgi:hypothetical protein